MMHKESPSSGRSRRSQGRLGKSTELEMDKCIQQMDASGEALKGIFKLSTWESAGRRGKGEGVPGRRNSKPKGLIVRET